MIALVRRVAIVIQTLLDIVLPRKERIVRTESYRADDIPVSPSGHEAWGITITTLLSYREPAVEDIIRAVKYDASRAAARLLADILAEYLREEIASIRIFSVHPILLIPVPLHKKRAQKRGFNQIEFILEQLPAEFRDGSTSRVEHGILLRVRNTPQQTQLRRSERVANVRNAFIIANPAAVIDTHAFIIDDVTTTGATLVEAARPFAYLGASVHALALARA